MKADNDKNNILGLLIKSSNHKLAIVIIFAMTLFITNVYYYLSPKKYHYHALISVAKMQIGNDVLASPLYDNIIFALRSKEIYLVKLLEDYQSTMAVKDFKERYGAMLENFKAKTIRDNQTVKYIFKDIDGKQAFYQKLAEDIVNKSASVDKDTLDAKLNQLNKEVDVYKQAVKNAMKDEKDTDRLVEKALSVLSRGPVKMAEWQNNSPSVGGFRGVVTSDRGSNLREIGPDGVNEGNNLNFEDVYIDTRGLNVASYLLSRADKYQTQAFSLNMDMLKREAQLASFQATKIVGKVSRSMLPVSLSYKKLMALSLVIALCASVFFMIIIDFRHAFRSARK